MREYAEAGNELIVGEVFGVEQAARQVAKDYPKTAFLMGSSFGPEAPNFAVFDNYIQECSYLTGLVAGTQTKSNLIGMVGGFPIPEVNRLMHAFMAGATEANPDVKFTVSFIGSWYDPPKAKESAFAMIDQGADVLYAERFGVSDAAKERGVKAVGNVIDTQDQYPGTVVASALWHMEPVDRQGAESRPGRHVHGRGLRPAQQPRRRRLLGGAAQRRAGADGRGRQGAGEGGGDPLRRAEGRRRRHRAQVDQVSPTAGTPPVLLPGGHHQAVRRAARQ